jgi:dTDP-glucose 4,6-dehydratase
MENIEVVEMICDILDEIRGEGDCRSRRELISFVEDRPGHDRRYAVDFTRVRRDLGWTPEESFETGIRKTIAWYMNHSDWVDRIRRGEYRSWIKEHYGS